MRCFPLLVAVICVVFVSTKAAPSGGEYEADIIDHVSNSTSLSSTKSQSKEKQNIKVKHKKDGSTVTIIKNKSKSKTVTKDLSDEFDQTNKTHISKDGSVDTDSDTDEAIRKSKKVDVIKKSEVERIVRDANGNIISDTKKSKTKEKEKTKEKTKNQHTEVKTHTDGGKEDVKIPVDNLCKPEVTTNKTHISKDGSVDTDNDTDQAIRKSKKVDVIKKSEVERTVKDANGNIISDTKKSKTKEKEKKKEKTKKKHTKVKTHTDGGKHDVKIPVDNLCKPEVTTTAKPVC